MCSWVFLDQRREAAVHRGLLPEESEGFSDQDGGASASPLAVFAVAWVPHAVPAQSCSEVLEGGDLWREFVVLLYE